MKRTCNILRVAAAAVLTAGLAVWLAGGAHAGWTRTSVEVRTLDEVTGIEGVTYEKRFLPGIEVLVLTVLASAGLAGASLFFRTGRLSTLSQAR